MYVGVFDLDPTGYEHAREVVLDWLRGHATLRDHREALTTLPIDLNLMVGEGLLAQALVDESDHVTVVRLQHRHFDGERRRVDPARNWRTEVTVGRDEDGAWLATRQWYLGFSGDELTPSVPRFVKTLLNEGALSDLDILESGVRIIEHAAEVGALATLILDENRYLPVIVMADGCPLDPQRVAVNSSGLAHVFRLTREARNALNDALARTELLHGALQTFSPRVEGVPPFVRAARFETILAWRYGDRTGPPAFGAWLHEQLARIGVLRLLNADGHQTIEAIKAEAIQSRRASLDARDQDVATLSEQLELTNMERDLLHVDLRDLGERLVEVTARAAEFSRDKEAADQALRDERERNHRLQQDKAALQFALSAKRGEESVRLTPAEVEDLIRNQPAPENIFEAIEQAERIFVLYGLRVLVSDQAKESAMEALAFKRPAQVQDALLRLGFCWSDIRESGQRLDQEATRILRSPTVMFESDTTMRHYGHQRDVRIGDVVVRLQKHVKLGGGGKGESARIYFGDKDGQLLIGHVGHHLDVASTQ